MIPSLSSKIVPHVIGVMLMIGFLAWLVGTLKEQGRAELRPVVEQLQNDLKSEQLARIRNEEALNEYQKEFDVIRSRPRATGPVRLCVTAPVPNPEFPAPSLTDTTATTWGYTGQAGGDLRAGADIGPALRELAYQCDAENAKLRALQGWARGLE